MKEAENRFEITKRVGLFGIIGNIFLLSIKAIVGFSTKSQAMIADSINSAGDIFASIMTSIGNKIASVPRDDDHNFGHGKAEYIFSMFISIAMILVSAKLFFDSINFHSDITLGNADNGGDFFVFITFKIKNDNRFFYFGQPVDGLI